MPRRNRRRDNDAHRRGANRPLLQNTVDAPDGRWQVRKIAAGAADKTYRCPGCNQEIRPGISHVVAWADGGDGEGRRHWHSSCWEMRHRRRPGRN